MIKCIAPNGNWTIKNSSFYEKHNKKCHKVKRRYFLNKETSRILGEATIGATIKIINHFKPKFWAIENPQTSKLWDFVNYHWNFKNNVNNLTYYSSYSLKFSKKPTIFKSNIKLDLKKNKIKGNKSHMALGSYSTRSSIPVNLVKDILDQFLKELKK